MPERSFPPRIYPHAIWVLVHACLTIGWGVALYATLRELPSVWSDSFVFSFIFGLGLFLALLFWLSATALCRRLSLLFRHPELSLSGRGIEIQCYRNGFKTLFKLWYAWQGQQIAWADFRGCRVERVGFGDFLLLRKSLVVVSSTVEIEITWGMFAPRVERLQREILDYYQLTVLAPDKDQVRVPEFLRLLFPGPLVFASPRLGRNEIFLSILILPVVGAYFVLRLAPEYGVAKPLAGYALFVGIAVPVAILVTRAWIRATRFIQLSADGISIGPDATSARLIPWHELAFARVHQFGSQPSSLTKLELRLRDGTAVYIRSLPEAALLASLIDPPSDLVRQAWSLIRSGQNAFAAAEAVGLFASPKVNRATASSDTQVLM